MKNNIQQISSALEVLDEDLKWRYSIDTSFGKQSPVYGYGVQEISLCSGHAVVTVEAYDRMLHENDESVRGGDTAVFHIDNKRVFSEEEWEQRCKMAEKVNEFTDADRLASLTASQTERFVDANGYDLTFTIVPLGKEDGKQMYTVTVSLYEDYDSDDSIMLQRENFTVDAFGLFSEVNESVMNGDMSNQYYKERLNRREEFSKQTEDAIHSLVHNLWTNGEQEQFPSAHTILEDRHGFLIQVELNMDEDEISLRADCQLDGTRSNTFQFVANETSSVLDKLREIVNGSMTSHYLLEAENKALNNRMAKTSSYERGE